MAYFKEEEAGLKILIWCVKTEGLSVWIDGKETVVADANYKPIPAEFMRAIERAVRDAADGWNEISYGFFDGKGEIVDVP